MNHETAIDEIGRALSGLPRNGEIQIHLMVCDGAISGLHIHKTEHFHLVERLYPEIPHAEEIPVNAPAPLPRKEADLFDAVPASEDKPKRHRFTLGKVEREFLRILDTLESRMKEDEPRKYEAIRSSLAAGRHPAFSYQTVMDMLKNKGIYSWHSKPSLLRKGLIGADEATVWRIDGGRGPSL